MTLIDRISEEMVAEAKTHYEVIVVGAGVAGIYQIKRLADLGIDATVLESAPDLGGTWYWNRYPGCRFDSESYTYGFSFSRELLDEWGTGRSAFPARLRICATSTTSPTSSICENRCSSTARSRRCASRRRAISGT